MKPTNNLLTTLFIGALLYANWVIFSPMFTSSGTSSETQEMAGDASVVWDENGQQVIHIVAQHGYKPRRIAAKANQPTILEFETKGYDCSAAVRIPALKIQQYLSTSGLTRIEVPPQAAGTTLTGLCSMGMYTFDIKFG